MEDPTLHIETLRIDSSCHIVRLQMHSVEHTTHNPPLSVTKYNINTSISKVTVESIDAAGVLVLIAGTTRRVGG